MRDYSYEKYKKLDLEMVLEEHLRANQSSLATDPKVAPFYQGVDPASPVKHSLGVAQKQRRKQTIKSNEEVDTPSVSSHGPGASIKTNAYTHARFKT